MLSFIVSFDVIVSVIRRDYIAPTDDLAFDLYQDPEVARIIRRLNRQKEDAVKRGFYLNVDFTKTWVLPKRGFYRRSLNAINIALILFHVWYISLFI